MADEIDFFELNQLYNKVIKQYRKERNHDKKSNFCSHDIWSDNNILCINKNLNPKDRINSNKQEIFDDDELSKEYFRVYEKILSNYKKLATTYDIAHFVPEIDNKYKF